MGLDLVYGSIYGCLTGIVWGKNWCTDVKESEYTDV